MTVQPILQSIVNDIEVDSPSWATFDFQNFSRDKKLWDYQQEALRRSVKALWLFYERWRDYSPTEDAENENRVRRLELWELYKDNGLTEIRLEKLSHKNAAILSDYFPVVDEKLDFRHLINRMSFWMATGSGKTLVIVKLIQLLATLIERKEIPENDILVLAHKPELLDQFRDHVRQFNNGGFGLYIRLHDFKEYGTVKRSSPDLFSGDELNVFTYRSDLFTLEQKEKQIDFRNYENGGNWYVLLDEAHKGDKTDSQRQHIYSILARNGFLFNFSATFTEATDIITTVSNFNLAEFVTHGYGKHIAILRSQIEAFKRSADDFTGDQKQRIVLQSLLVLTLISRQMEKVREVEATLYHKPLLVTLVNSVNTEDADLLLFFRELERLATGDVTEAILKEARNELWRDIDSGIHRMFEPEEVNLAYSELDQIKLKDVRRAVFNSDAKGSIEVIRRPSDRKELAFKLQNADAPFALIRIGDISDWLKNNLTDYEINETFDDEGFFENLNRDSSDIKILMGSRTFYEGWDSNRPNVINFINIGTKADARKFVLQSIGRGVRIEPFPGKRQRIRNLRNAAKIEENTFESVKGPADLLETLMIFGTKRDVIENVVKELDKERPTTVHILELDKNTDITMSPLLIPVFKDAAQRMIAYSNRRRYDVLEEELAALKNYVEFIDNDVILMLRHRTSPDDLAGLKTTLKNDNRYYSTTREARRFGGIDLLWNNLVGYFNILPKEFHHFKELENEISHYKQVEVRIEDVRKLEELKSKIEKVQNVSAAQAEQDELRRQFDDKPMTFDEIMEQAKKLVLRAATSETFDYQGVQLDIKRLASHYYIPSILSNQEKAAFISHIIKVPSEVEFVRTLAAYIGSDADRLNSFDDWAFSKIDETADSVTIPYVDRFRNMNRTFNPDFVFWFKKGKEYSIVFIDPKGGQFAGSYSHKLDGYKELFQVGSEPRVFRYDSLNVRVFAFLYNKDREALGSGLFPDFWVDGIGGVVERILDAK